MSLNTDRENLLQVMANTLIINAVNDQGFFYNLAAILNEKGYRFCIRQNGIQGSFVWIEELNPRE